MLRVDVSKQLGEFTLEASFTSEGRVTGLFGASGAGKTSLINMIAGLVKPDRGTIALDGETLDDTAARIARPAASPPHRLCVPGRAAVSASRCQPEPRLRAAHEPPRRRSRAAQARHRPARYRQPAGPPSRQAVGRRTPARRASAARCCRSRDCCCWTNRWVRWTRDASWRSCPIWCGCATRPAFPWSMSATTPRKCVNSRRRS